LSQSKEIEPEPVPVTCTLEGAGQLVSGLCGLAVAKSIVSKKAKTLKRFFMVEKI
jgi:hypothetical protein